MATTAEMGGWINGKLGTEDVKVCKSLPNTLVHTPTGIRLVCYEGASSCFIEVERECGQRGKLAMWHLTKDPKALAKCAAYLQKKQKAMAKAKAEKEEKDEFRDACLSPVVNLLLGLGSRIDYETPGYQTHILPNDISVTIRANENGAVEVTNIEFPEEMTHLGYTALLKGLAAIGK